MAEISKWYVVHTYSGYENKVATNIEKIVENRKMHDLILEVKVPTEIVVENKEAKDKETGEMVIVKKEVERNPVIENKAANNIMIMLYAFVVVSFINTFSLYSCMWYFTQV